MTNLRDSGSADIAGLTHAAWSNGPGSGIRYIKYSLLCSTKEVTIATHAFQSTRRNFGISLTIHLNWVGSSGST